MAQRTVTGKTRPWGFTLIELLVVMAIIATLLSIAAPRYLRSVDDAQEAALKANLAHLREAIDQFHADTGSYPEALTDLVEKRYLRAIPVDPITQSAQTWQVLPPPHDKTDMDTGEEPSDSVYNVRSGAEGSSRLGEPYANW